MLGIDAVGFGELAHPFERQRLQVEPFDSCRCREVSDHGPQRVRRMQLVVAKRRDHESARPFDATPEQAEDVERRLVGPVEVFQHEHGRLSVQLLDEGTEHLVRPGVAPDQLRKRAACLGGDSAIGAKGRGVKSASQAPSRMRVLPEASAQKRRMRAVLPTPASPAISTSRPAPSSTSWRASESASRNDSRSRRAPAVTVLMGRWWSASPWAASRGAVGSR
jgi:hypothetical protein